MSPRPDFRDTGGGDAVVTVSHLQKRYGAFEAVKDATFAVARGEIFGLLGPNGAGKTTTIECLQGLRAYDGGTARVLGLDPRTDARRLRQRIGCQLQESALPDHIRVWEALQLFSSISTRGADWRELLEAWGLHDKRDSPYAKLSGGQRQRLFVALALLNDPELVFLDEMTTGLDPGARLVTWQLIREIRDGGATVVLVTHFMDEAQRLCDRLAVVDQGRVVALDAPQALIAAHAGGVRVVFTTDAPDVSFLETARWVDRVVRHGPRVEVHGHHAVLATVAAALVAHDITPPDLHLEEPTLEDVFLVLTGHDLGE